MKGAWPVSGRENGLVVFLRGSLLIVGSPTTASDCHRQEGTVQEASRSTISLAVFEPLEARLLLEGALSGLNLLASYRALGAPGVAQLHNAALDVDSFIPADIFQNYPERVPLLRSQLSSISPGPSG